MYAGANFALGACSLDSLCFLPGHAGTSTFGTATMATLERPILRPRDGLIVDAGGHAIHFVAFIES